VGGQKEDIVEGQRLLDDAHAEPFGQSGIILASMKRLLFLAWAFALAGAASAQLYRWVDKDGRVHYTSTPPPAGVQSRALAAPSASPPPAAQEERKGPLTPAEQEAEFRKRRLEEQKAQEKSAATAKEEATKQANCQHAREGLTALESGERIARTDAQGQRYYLDDDARGAEIRRAQRVVQEWCN
jgi:hypothetical protein